MSGRTATVFGICKHRPHLEKTVTALRLGGFRDDDISVIYPDRTSVRHVAHSHDSRPDQNVGAGARIGIILGGILGFWASIRALSVYALSPLLAAGPFLASLAGAGVGSTVGGLTGLLIGRLRVQEPETKRHEEIAMPRGILLSIHVNGPAWNRKARKILTECQLTDVFSACETVSNATSSDGDPQRRCSGIF